jgi:hypothetical protein
MSSKTAALVAFIAVLCSAMAARAYTGSVAVLQADNELLRAISLALSPWGIETIGSDAPFPERSQPEAVQVAARLARELGVEALVWVTSLKQGSLLWVFDVRTGDVTTRMLTETPPFDSAAAAAVALSVKTVLRASVVAPPEERFGAQVTAPMLDRISAVEVGAGGHWLGDRQLDFRVGIAGVLWLPAFRRLGLAVAGSTGPGFRIDDVAYRGRYRELVVGAKLRFLAVHLPAWSAAVALGGALHWTTLTGRLLVDSKNSNVDRLNGSVNLETLFSFKLSSRLYFGASLGAAYFPAYRRYLVRGRPVFAPLPFTTNLTGYCGAEPF